MSQPIFRLLNPGMKATIQDRGRAQWRPWGVPISGPMDTHAATWANRLLDNSPDAPLIEFLLQGAQLEVLANLWVAVTGAENELNIPRWRAVHLEAGQRITFGPCRAGVWSYLAVEDGFAAPRLLGSVSTYLRGHLGTALAPGDVLSQAPGRPFQLPTGVAGRVAAWTEIRHYQSPPPLRIWPGPQWEQFSHAVRSAFLSQDWTVSSQSDRVGYRLEGQPLPVPLTSEHLVSEPVRVGSIQVPENGQPIVIMRDGPSVGGYPKIGLVHPDDLCWLAQCQPGQAVRFRPWDET